MRCIGQILVVVTLLASSACVAPAPVVPEGTTDVNVGLLLLDGVYNTELTAPLDIFHHTAFHAPPRGMRVFTVGRSREVVTTFEGLHIIPDYDLESAPPIDVLVVPSGKHSLDSDLEDERLIDWVRRRGKSGLGILLGVWS